MAELSYIQVTRDCNANCLFCSNPPTKYRLDLDQAKKIVDGLALQKTPGVILTGGEPTLYPQLPELIKYCFHKRVLPRIITNGQKIADLAYLRTLQQAGLRHIHLSIFSCRPDVQEMISRKTGVLKKIEQSLRNILKLRGMAVNVNIVINKYNADHLSEVVSWLIEKYGFVNHFVFNNLDPGMSRVRKNPGVIPRLNDFELELHKALCLLEKHGKTFRVERVPLCYLTDFEHVSTETRKIVKEESRTIYFLDQRGAVFQDSWYYKKGDCCRVCTLNKICAGLHALNDGYEEKELYPVFVNPQEIIEKIHNSL